MQPIERYALVTLLFLVVLVMVVALWDDGSDSKVSPESQQVARVAEPAAPGAGAARRTVDASGRTSGRPPVGGKNELEGSASRVRTRAGTGTQHRVEPGGAPLEPAAQPPEAQPASELRDTLSPFGDRQRAPRGPEDVDDPTASGALVAEGNLGPVPRRANDTPDGAEPTVADRRRDTGSTPKLDQPSPSVDRPMKKESASKPRGDDLASGSRDYVIQSGDSFERIARRELGDSGAADAIASLNGLTLKDTIYQGKTLKLPLRSDVAKRGGASAQSPTAAPGGGRSVYTFKRGDMLSVVLVEKFGTYKRSIALVKELNPGMNPDRIVEGTPIVLPRADEIPGGVTVAKPSVAFAVPRTRRTASTKNEFVVR